MTSQGSPLARFRRAIKTGNLNIIRAAALELPHVSLPDALAICAVIAEQQPEAYERAAVRWLHRYAMEAKPDLRALEAVARAFVEGDLRGLAARL